MDIKDKEFLEEHIVNWNTCKDGYLRNIDLPILKMYEHIYRTYVDDRFILTIWCGGCKMDLVKRLYTFYENNR